MPQGGVVSVLSYSSGASSGMISLRLHQTTSLQRIMVVKWIAAFKTL